MMVYFKKNLSILAVICGCFIINGCAGSNSPIPEPDCEPKWYHNDKYASTSKIIYGRGVMSSHSRQAARRAAQAYANNEVLTQLKSHILTELDINIDNNFSKDAQGQNVSDFRNGLQDNLNQLTDMTCTLCRLSKTEDCQNKGIWESYFMSNLNIEEWKQTTWDPIIDQAINKASGEIKEQRDAFHKRHELD